MKLPRCLADVSNEFHANCFRTSIPPEICRDAPASVLHYCQRLGPAVRDKCAQVEPSQHEQPPWRRK
jgi:hypothetical protein